MVAVLASSNWVHHGCYLLVTWAGAVVVAEHSYQPWKRMAMPDSNPVEFVGGWREASACMGINGAHEGDRNEFCVARRD